MHETSFKYFVNERSAHEYIIILYIQAILRNPLILGKWDKIKNLWQISLSKCCDWLLAHFPPPFTFCFNPVALMNLIAVSLVIVWEDVEMWWTQLTCTQLNRLEIHSLTNSTTSPGSSAYCILCTFYVLYVTHALLSLFYKGSFIT